ncbi:MAG TPA: phosphatase PAP2 family protein [Candidatus Paceibacterota bacterium]
MLHSIRAFLSKLRVEEFFAICISTLASIALLFIDPHLLFSPLFVLKLMVRYFTFGDPLYTLFFVFIWAIVIWYIYIALGKLVSNLIERKSVNKKETLTIVSHSLPYVRLLIPVVIASIPVYALFLSASYFLRNAGHDLTLLHWDYTIFSTSPFLTLPSLGLSTFIEETLFYSYISLGFVVSGSLILFVLLKKIILVRKQIFSFLLSLLLSAPFFYFYSCQDPGNFFLRNLRNNRFPVEIQNLLQNYRPSPFTADKISVMAESETFSPENSVPITCFPSAHAIWGALSVYYLAIWSPLTLIVSVPWIMLMLTAGLYFAQHYLVDYLAAIPITVLCIVATNEIFRAKFFKRKAEGNS